MLEPRKGFFPVSFSLLFSLLFPFLFSLPFTLLRCIQRALINLSTALAPPKEVLVKTNQKEVLRGAARWKGVTFLGKKLFMPILVRKHALSVASRGTTVPVTRVAARINV